MLKACAFDSKTGELGGAMPLAFNVSDAFVRLQRTLKLKAGTLETRKEDSPTWAPPRLRAAKTDNGQEYRELAFLRFKLENQPQLEAAVDSVETFWKMTLMLYKVRGVAAGRV